jgi:hypothetical protein
MFPLFQEKHHLQHIALVQPFTIHFWAIFSEKGNVNAQVHKGKTAGQEIGHPKAELQIWKPHPWCDRTISGSGSSSRISLSDSKWSENTINTHKYNNIYWCSSKSYYNLGSCISYTEEVWSQNYASEDKSEFAEVISLNGKNILFALKENAIHQRSKPEDPSTEPNPHQFGLPTDIPHRHRWKEEAVPHVHTEKQQEQSLRDYTQQDLFKVTKKSPLDMQGL